MTASGGDSYLWSTGATTAALSVNAAGTFAVTVTDANGCTATASSTVNQNNTPPAAAIAPATLTLTCAAPSGILTASGGDIYLWSTGATTAVLSVNAAGIFAVTVTDANGCTATASSTVNQNNTPPAAAIAPATLTLTCAVPSGILTASGGDSYLWSTGETASGLSVSLAGAYAVTVVSANGCTASAEAIVSANLNAQPPTIACPGDRTLNGNGVLLLPNFTALASVTSFCGPAVVTQMPLNGTMYADTQSVTVVLTATDAQGGTASCSFMVTLNVGPPDDVCTFLNGPVVYVDSSATGANNGSSWADAYTNLQSALAGIVPNTTVLLAKGTYFPTSGNDRTRTFALPSNIALIGGYPNGGGVADPVANPTVLSGDIGLRGSNVDNSYRVLTLINSGNGSLVCGLTIRDANSNFNGGGVYVLANGATAQVSPTFRNCTFRNNRSSLKGGGLYILAQSGANASPVFEYCLFAQNIGQTDGGAITSVSQTGATINASFFEAVFENNSTTQRGGAINNMVNAGGTTVFTMSNPVFRSNSAAINGGAIFNFSRGGSLLSMNLMSPTFLSNTAQNGGAVFNNPTTGQIQFQAVQGNFRLNTANRAGGAIFSQSDLVGGTVTTTVENCLFIQNQSADGGALCINSTRGGTGQFTAFGCSFRGNISNGRGGAITHLASMIQSLPSSTQIQVTNCVFHANRAQTGLGGVLYQRVSEGGSAVFNSMNCSFASNVAFGQGSVATNDVVSGASTANFVNSIFWNNTSTLASGRPFFDAGTQSATNLSYSLLQPSNCVLSESGPGTFACGAGMLYATDPQFVDLAGGNLRLLGNSPALDMGTATGAPALDWDGVARPQGASHDMGAYERFSLGAEVSIAGDTALCTGESTLLTAESGPSGSTYLWSTGETTQSITVSPSVSTAYEVTLTAPFGATASDTATVTVSPLTVGIAPGAPVLCANGSVVLTASGAVDYVWSTGQTSGSVSVLFAGTYSVTGSLAGGCSGSATVSVADAAPIFVVVTATPATCANGCDATATATAAVPATFAWSNGAMGPNAPALCVGSYTVMATDANGCTQSASTTIVNVDLPPTIVCPTTQTLIGAGTAYLMDYTVQATVSDDCGPVTVVQSPAVGTAYVFPGTVAVTLTATDAVGQTATCSFEVEVTIMPPPTSVCFPENGPAIFVDDDATGNGSGTSWANAMTSLQAALSAAVPNTNILVAQGIYRPTDDTSRSATFHLPPSINLFGGFPNGGGLYAQPDLYPSVLSGDIGVPGNTADNSQRILTSINVGDDVLICGFEIRDANSPLEGAGVFVKADSVGKVSSPYFADCRFVQNYTAQRGGGAMVFALDGGTADPRFDYCRFTGNTAALHGGGLATVTQNGGSVNLQVFFSVFEQNNALQRGGAMMNTTNAGGTTLVTSDACTFQSNTSALGGGAIWDFSTNGATQYHTINGSTFQTNSSVNGGAFYANTMGGVLNLQVNGCNFWSNTAPSATGKGGAINLYSDLTAGSIVAQIGLCDFQGNTASDGGAIYHQAARSAVSSLTVAQSRFAQNIGSGRGGAFSQTAAQISANALTSFTNCLFWANASTAGTGGTFNQNTATTGQSSVALMNCSVASNTAYGNGSVSFLNAGIGTSASLTATNCVFWNNTTTLVTGRPFFQATAVSAAGVSFSLLQGASCALNSGGASALSCGAGNIFGANPQFVDLANGDLQLQAGSPAIDAGTFAGAPFDDYNGNFRPAGAGIDAGAFEYVPMFARSLPTGTVQPRPLTATAFPNPTSGTVTISLDREIEGLAQLFDLQGRPVAQQQINGANQTVFDLSDLPGGTYLMRIVSGETVLTKQIVVARP